MLICSMNHMHTKDHIYLFFHCKAFLMVPCFSVLIKKNSIFSLFVIGEDKSSIFFFKKKLLIRFIIICKFKEIGHSHNCRKQKIPRQTPFP